MTQALIYLRTPLELFPSAKPQVHPQRQVARPHHQQWDTVTCWYPQHSLPPQACSLLSQRRLRWFGHVHRMDDGHIPKDVLYGQLTTGVKKSRTPRSAVHERSQTWPQSMWNWSKQLGRCREVSCPLVTDSERRNRESRRETSPENWREAVLASNTALLCPPPTSSASCRDFHSRIRLHSHTRRCSTTTNWLGCTIFAPLGFRLPIIIRQIPLQTRLESVFNDIFSTSTF